MDPDCLKRSLLVLAWTLVAAAAPAPGGAAPFQDLPVPGGTAALARTLGVDPVPERGRFIAELTRLVYDVEARNPTAAAFLQTIRLKARAAVERGVTYRALANLPQTGSEPVPVPLTADTWGDVVFRRRVAPDELIHLILADRQAALLCHGLTALDDETLEYFADHPSLISRLYERSAAAFSVFSGAIRIRGNRVVPAGAAEGRPAEGERDEVTTLWEAVVGARVTRPERFLLALFEASEGRLAYVYDLAGHLDEARRAFLLGLWIDDRVKRLERFKALATVGMNAFKDWHVRTMPYGRSSWDLAMAVARLEVSPRGAPAPPASRAFWERVFASSDVSEDVVRAAGSSDDSPIDAAWLAEAVGGSDIRQRVERLDQIALAQRRFYRSAADEPAAVAVALRALPHYRMLILTLDRIGVRTPALYAATARLAHRLAPLPGARGFVAQAQFQGALAIVARMASVNTITPRQAEHLIDRLVTVTMTEDGRFAGGVAGWLQNEVGPAVAASGGDGTLETALIAAVAGGASAGDRPIHLVWEGQRYRLDLGFAERRRLQRVRERQEAIPVDLPVQVCAVARRLASEAPHAVDVEIDQLRALIDRLPRRLRPDMLRGGPSGVSAGPDAQEMLRKAIDELARIGRSREARREARVAATLMDLGDELLGHVLLSFAYAMNIGDPDGSALLAGDVSYRHDFGFGVKDGPIRARAAWAMARQEVAPGVPWHVSGSLLGLELGLAGLALRRINFEHLTGAPKLTSNERDAFAASVAVMNPYALRDADRDAIVEAIARGRARVLALHGDPGPFEAVADEIGMDARRRREVRWVMAHSADASGTERGRSRGGPATESGRSADALLSMFSFTELLSLGGADLDALDAWGMIGLTTTGCLCSRLGPVGRWWLLAGRPQLGMVATGVADLHLHVAMRLRELQVPAALAKVVLSGAVQDFIDEVRPTDDGDWLTLARVARTPTREQIEDYLAVATADGPLVPDVTTSAPGVP